MSEVYDGVGGGDGGKSYDGLNAHMAFCCALRKSERRQTQPEDKHNLAVTARNKQGATNNTGGRWHTVYSGVDDSDGPQTSDGSRLNIYMASS